MMGLDERSKNRIDVKEVSEVMTETMRRYVRHPSNIPITYCLGDSSAEGCEALKDVGQGGVCFSIDTPLEAGSAIHIAIPIDSEPFEAEGHVAWCKEEGGLYAVGVEFKDKSTHFNVRMIEQVCHIEDYRSRAINEGRDLSGEQAAKEWVEKFAENFPMRIM